MPWQLGGEATPTARDVPEGATELHRLVLLLLHMRMVVNASSVPKQAWAANVAPPLADIRMVIGSGAPARGTTNQPSGAGPASIRRRCGCRYSSIGQSPLL